MKEIVRIGIALSKDAHRRFVAQSKELGLSQSALVDTLILAMDDPEFAGVVKKVRQKTVAAVKARRDLMELLANKPELAAQMIKQIKSSE